MTIADQGDWAYMSEPVTATPLDNSTGKEQTRIKLFNHDVISIAAKKFGEPRYGLAKLAFWHWKEVIIDGDKYLINVSSAQKRLARIGITADKVREYLQTGSFTQFIQSVRKDLRDVNRSPLADRELVQLKIDQTVPKSINLRVHMLNTTARPRGMKAPAHEIRVLQNGVFDQNIAIKPHQIIEGGDSVVYAVTTDEKTDVLAIPLIRHFRPYEREPPRVQIPIFPGLVQERLCTIKVVKGEDENSSNTGVLTCRLMENYTNKDMAEQRKALREMEIQDKLKMAYHLLSAMEHLHAQNIVHNDLKPDNVFLTENWDIGIGDFDYACKEGQEDRFVGTFAYMSPELLDARRDGDSQWSKVMGKPGDCWSMGCLLYDCFIGNLPWHKDELLNNGDLRRKNLPAPKDTTEQKFFKQVISPLLQPARGRRMTMEQARMAVQALYEVSGFGTLGE